VGITKPLDLSQVTTEGDADYGLMGDVSSIDSGKPHSSFDDRDAAADGKTKEYPVAGVAAGKVSVSAQNSGVKALNKIRATGSSTGEFSDEEDGDAGVSSVFENLSDCKQIPTETTRIVVKERLNNARYLNKFLEFINSSLPVGGELVCYVESNEQRYERKSSGFPKYLHTVGRFYDFVVHRVLPKVSFTQGLYFSVTKGHDRPVSLSEMLGRLISCGFKVQTFDVVGGLIRISSTKIGEPAFNKHASYGFLIKLTRVGRNAGNVGIYKLRTMHPYSEYLQDYIFQMNNLSHGGKFKDDFRVTTWGRWLRKFWLDEQPMWINFLRGEMKLVGVRPLSRHYFELYPKEMQEYRSRFKPGLLPPFYADMPVTFEEIVDSERRYLQQFEKDPYRTDLRYLLTIFKNIFIRRARSS
jgi:lipopolysaccharide/colanic/teichoic acid biosynthesis glycosyltransferase